MHVAALHHATLASLNWLLIFMLYCILFSIRNPKWKFNPETMAGSVPHPHFVHCRNAVAHLVQNKQQIAITNANGMERAASVCCHFRGALNSCIFLFCLVWFIRCSHLSTAVWQFGSWHIHQNRNGFLTMAISM